MTAVLDMTRTGDLKTRFGKKDDDDLTALIDDFVEGTTRYAAAINEYRQTYDMRGIARAAHALKDLSSTFGARQMATIAGQIAAAAGENDADLDLLVARLLVAYEEVWLALCGWCKDGGKAKV